MEVLQFFSQLNQAFSFGIVVWDSKLFRHGNWGELGPFETKKNKDWSKKVTYALFAGKPSFIKVNCVGPENTYIPSSQKVGFGPSSGPLTWY